MNARARAREHRRIGRNAWLVMAGAAVFIVWGLPHWFARLVVVIVMAAAALIRGMAMEGEFRALHDLSRLTDDPKEATRG